ncbi:MAG: DNA-processing protein DprA [Bacteroidales bacterium]|nr:DNA-processing protein DprA [Bacteroidales bacterium]
MQNDLFYKLALYFTPGINLRTAQQLQEHFGQPADIFHLSAVELTNAGLRADIAESIGNHDTFRQAEQEMAYMEQHHIGCLFYTDPMYPERLRQCEDAPLLFFYRGSLCFEAAHAISVVGTRKPTEYGELFCRHLIEDLSGKIDNLLIVSGLAYGIDICAHRAALDCNVPTAAVFGTSFSHVYPASHRKDAVSIMSNGGALVSEFSSDMPTYPANFVRRNRIIAGLTDATVIVESAAKGGSLITADIAASYNREVFAVPGRPSDAQSAGCNWLVRTARAHLLTSADDLLYIMGWEAKDAAAGKHTDRTERLTGCSEEEQQIVRLLQDSGGKAGYEEMNRALAFADAGMLPAALLNLEIAGLIQTLPGRRYTLL